ncbi:MAG TPA: peptidase M48 Ste24p [Gammaproteobacteria bacterium]|nr:peptidase M48 Ste24p [Gammaproteobacteria bacterium]
MNITFTPGSVFRLFLLIIGVLTYLNVLVLIFWFEYDDPFHTFSKYFDVGRERNIPTLYSVMALTVAATLLATNARHSWEKCDGQHRYWAGLALIFLFLAFDEGTKIHEQMSDVMERWVTPKGYLLWLWVIPYGFAVLVLAGVYLRFLIRLSRTTRYYFILAALLFIGGAIGVEMLSAWEMDLNEHTILYCVLYSLEEFLEMIGVAVFIYALLKNLADESPVIRITLLQ